MNIIDVNKFQTILKAMNFDGWLFYDFRGSNDLALNILKVPKESHLTRRFYYFIPADGTPVKIVNGIEAHNLNHLPGEQLLYSSHSILTGHLSKILKDVKTIAMEYSPLNAIPYVSKVDAGTIEQIKSFGVEIKSSADLISLFDAVWTKEQYEENIPVANALYEIVQSAFRLIKTKITQNLPVNEYEVQQFIMNEFDKRCYFTDHPPIVGVNENSANPHYAPDSKNFKPITEGDFVLIDLWAKVDKDSGVWSDITWVGFAGKEIPTKYKKIFDIVAEARDTAFDLIISRFNEGKEVRGFELDDASRKVIEKAGYGEYFIHRTGHSITNSLHGSGAHLDNFETKDERLILPSTSFSIEPGIYLTGDFGVRSEIDVYVTENMEVIQTGGSRQTEVLAILK